MIVEDNPILRESIMQMLTHLGYATLEVSNGTEALSVLAEIETPPAIILSDVVMPQMDGLELSQAIAERYPEQKMLFMTGYPFQEDRAGMGKVPWIQKPFDSDHLTTKLRAVLDESSRSPIIKKV
ncbi:MAG: response regulator [Chloroflexi bacterium]|nr:response regulator [Chloroflexota bacterium]